MQRLEQLEITKVAFVPEGDNKKADILLFKSKPKEDEPPIPAPADEQETRTLKRFFLALAKSLGFDVEKAEVDPAEKKPEEDDLPKDDEGGDGAKKPTGTPAVNEQKEKEKQECKSCENKTAKGVTNDMKFDKSKLSAEELAQLEAIEKKAGIAEGDPAADDGVAKGAAGAGTTPAGGDAGNDGEDIYKGLHPAVAAELKKLRERADAAETHEMEQVAKKYELLGKDTKELAKTLKVLKSAGSGAYEQMIAVLDASLDAVEKSGAFGEVGKSGNGGKADPWKQIEAHADAIMKAAPTMTRNQAIDKACEQHPELVAEYEQSR